LKQSVAVAPGRLGPWTEDEDNKLINSVQSHGGKDWFAIATLVPGRTKSQCWYRWKKFCAVPTRSTVREEEHVTLAWE
jgi:hypothetical protein